MEYTIGTKVFQKWTIVGDLGEGANGKVFVIEKNEFGVETRSALKVIRIPRSQSHVREVMSEGMDEASAALYFREAVDRLLREAAVMASLKAHPHIVGYEDHEVVPQEGGIGWDILIRMELLTPLADHLMGRTMTEEEVLRLGMELTEALVYCQGKEIIHRDIKLSNVLVNEFGQYKLGDFGVARTLDQTRSGLSHSGTVDYMAPEIYYDRPYGPTVDLYSLGLVLYVLMNGNRLPFLPEAPRRIRHGEKEEARERRLRGDALPSPRYASEAFASVILRACAYDSRERYRTARELLEALRSVAEGDLEETSSWEEDPRKECSLSDEENTFEEEPTCSVWGDRDTVDGEKDEQEIAETEEEDEDEKTHRIRGGMILFAVILLTLILGTLAWLMQRSRDGWVLRGEESYYYVEGKKVKGLTTIDGIEYYFDTKGAMQTGRITDGSDTYYLNEQGQLLYAEVTETEIKTTRSEEAISINGRKIYGRILEQPLENVVSLNVEVTVTEVKKGEPNGQRSVYVRNLDGQWLPIGVMTVSDLHGEGRFVFEYPISFDAIVCPEDTSVDGGFSGNISQKITEVTYRMAGVGMCKEGHQWTEREHIQNRVCDICGQIKPFVFIRSSAFGAWTTGLPEPICGSVDNRVIILWDVMDKNGPGQIYVRNARLEEVPAEWFEIEWGGSVVTLSPTETLEVGNYIIDLEGEGYQYQFDVLYGDEELWYPAMEGVTFSRATRLQAVVSGVSVYVEGEAPLLGNDLIKISLDDLESVEEDNILVISTSGEDGEAVICDCYVSGYGERYLLRYQDKYLASGAEGDRYYLSEEVTKECWWEYDN